MTTRRCARPAPVSRWPTLMPRRMVIGEVEFVYRIVTILDRPGLEMVY